MNRDIPTIEEYIKIAKAEPTLTAQEEKKLFELYRNGDEDAGLDLINSYMKIAIDIAEQYEGKGLRLIDLISAGVYGLKKAFDKYDLANSVPFSEFAPAFIRSAINNELSRIDRKSTYPREKIVLTNAIINASRKLMKETGQVPSNEDIAAELGISVEKVREVTESMDI